MAEHRVYLACCGLFMAVGIGAASVQARFAAVRARSFDRAAKIAFGVIVLSLDALPLYGMWCGAMKSVCGKKPEVLRRTIGCRISCSARRWIQRGTGWMPYRIRRSASPPSRGRGHLPQAWRQPDRTSAVRRSGGVVRAAARSHPALGYAFPWLRRYRDGPAGPRRRPGHLLEALARDASNVEARQSLALLAEAEPANPAEALRLCREIHELGTGDAGKQRVHREKRHSSGQRPTIASSSPASSGFMWPSTEVALSTKT